MLTEENCEEIEKVQKCAYSIIFGYVSYDKMLSETNTKSLESRRAELIQKFAVKHAKNGPIHSNWFMKKEVSINTRNPKRYKEIQARCDRWFRSPIPHMTRLLNNI